MVATPGSFLHMENGYIHIMVSNGDNYEDEQWVGLGDPVRKK